MTRVKRGIISRKKHKKVLKLNRGYRMTRRRLIKVAKEAALHAGEYAYRGRKEKKRSFRRLWIIKIKGALSSLGISYNQFINNLKKEKINLDRKILAELATNDFETFKKVVEKAKG